MKHGESAFRKFANAARQARKWTAPLPGGFFLTDPARIEDPLAIVRALPPSIGVIIRHFGLPDAVSKTAPIVEACKKDRRMVLVAADPELAAMTGADGIHLPFRLRDQATPYRRHFGTMTLSVHSAGEVARARPAAADALILSTLFGSQSPTAGTPMGLARLSSIARSSSRPVYAMGGITAANAGRVSAHCGFASVSGFQELA